MKILLVFWSNLLALSTSASSILFIGDSHSVGPFGWKFDELLRLEGHEVSTYASCGSIAKWWSTGQKTTCGYFSRDKMGRKIQVKEHETPKITELLKELHPQVVVIELGGNYVKTPSDEFVLKDIDTLINKITDTGSSCFWITNPDTRTYRSDIPRINKLIHAAIADRCPVFDSHLVTKYPETGGDGVHYWSQTGTPIAEAWAKNAYDAFKAVHP